MKKIDCEFASARKEPVLVQPKPAELVVNPEEIRKAMREHLKKTTFKIPNHECQN
jgi:hypothetical protein